MSDVSSDGAAGSTEGIPNPDGGLRPRFAQWRDQVHGRNRWLAGFVAGVLLSALASIPFADDRPNKQVLARAVTPPTTTTTPSVPADPATETTTSTLAPSTTTKPKAAKAGTDAKAGTPSTVAAAPPSTTVAEPTSTDDAGFSLSCPPSVAVERGSSSAVTCSLASRAPAAESVEIRCSALGGGVTCTGPPSSVTMPANGSVSFELTIAVSDGAAHAAPVRVRATHRSRGPQTAVIEVRSPDFKMSCGSANLAAPPAAHGGSCSVRSLSGYSAPVQISCSAPAGWSCAVDPSVTPPPDGVASVGMTVTPDGSVGAGSYSFTVTGSDGKRSRSGTYTVTYS